LVSTSPGARPWAHKALEIDGDGGVAIAAIGCDCSWTGATSHTPDCGTELGRVRRVAELNVVIKDDTVLVVDDLGFVAGLDMLAKPTFADRSSV